MSSYIEKQCPNMYGNRQSDYKKETYKVVSEFSNKIRQAVQDKKDLKVLFHDTLAIMGEARNKIARDHGTVKAELFGLRRDSGNIFSISAITYLVKPYAEYNAKLLSIIQNHLTHMMEGSQNSNQNELRIPGERCLEKNYLTEISIQSTNDVKKWIQSPTYEECERLSNVCNIPAPKEPVSVVNYFNSMVTNFEVMRTLKKNSTHDYKRLCNSIALQKIKKTFPFIWHLTDWILMTNRLEVDGKMYAMSQYLLWMMPSPVNHSLMNMPDPIITIIHQDLFLIEPMLNDIANIFQQAIECDSNDLKTLKNHVALLQFEFAHTMPFKRGSAAISEWLEMAIYLYHGYKLTYNPNKMVNLEALTSPLSEFITNYDSMIELDKI